MDWSHLDPEFVVVSNAERSHQTSEAVALVRIDAPISGPATITVGPTTRSVVIQSVIQNLTLALVVPGESDLIEIVDVSTGTVELSLDTSSPLRALTLGGKAVTLANVTSVGQLMLIPGYATRLTPDPSGLEVQSLVSVQPNMYPGDLRDHPDRPPIGRPRKQGPATLEVNGSTLRIPGKVRQDVVFEFPRQPNLSSASDSTARVELPRIDQNVELAASIVFRGPGQVVLQERSVLHGVHFSSRNAAVSSQRAALLPRLEMRKDAQLRAATGDVVCTNLQSGSLIYGCEDRGITIHSLVKAENAALLSADLSKVPLSDLQMVTRLRRLGLHWKTSPRMREKHGHRGALQMARLPTKERPRKTLRASKSLLTETSDYAAKREDAHRWAVIQQTVKTKNTAGRDFVWASYLAAESRRRAADGKERLALWAARVFGYGCKLFWPLVLVQLLALGAALALKIYGLDTSADPSLLQMYLDIAASPISSLREGGGLNEETTDLVHGGWLRLMMILYAVLGSIGYFSSVIAAIRYLRSNRSVEMA